MKNYLVKATRNFNDTVEKNEYGLDTPRVANVSTWHCTKERYEFLKQNNAVTLLGIDEIKEEPKVEAKIEYHEEPKETKAVVKIEKKKPEPKAKTAKKKTSKK